MLNVPLGLANFPWRACERFGDKFKNDKPNFGATEPDVMCDTTISHADTTISNMGNTISDVVSVLNTTNSESGMTN